MILGLFGFVKNVDSTFSFRSDVEEHVEKMGHNNINEYDMMSGKLLTED